MNSQTFKLNVKIPAWGKDLKRLGHLDFNCSRVSQQLLILSKWEVWGSGRCLCLKVQSCSTGTQWQPCSRGLWLPLPAWQRVGTFSVSLHYALEPGLNLEPWLVP